MTDLRRTIGQRLRKCRDERGWTLEEAVKRLSHIATNPIGTTGMNMWELGERLPKLDAFVPLGKLYGVPASWLAGLDENQHAGDYFFPQTGTNEPGLLLDNSIADDAIAFRAAFLSEHNLSPDNLMLVRVPDDSMHGLLAKGDRVLIDLQKIEVTQRDLFAILVSGRIWIRWIRPEMDGTYTVSSTDPDHYPDMKCTAAELQKIQIIGRVVMIVTSR